MSGEQAGHKKNCFKCNTPLVYVQKGDNLQWQNEADGKAHYTFISDKNYKCNIPEAKPTPEPKAESNTITVKGPFDEAELIVRWASERAFKITMAGIENANDLTVQKQNALGQKEGMLTRLLADSVLELMKQHGIKTKYPGESSGN